MTAQRVHDGRLRFEGSEPWGARDLAEFSVAVVVGAGLLLVSWVEASGRTSVDQQIPWIGLGLGGLLVLGVACALWVLAGRRRAGERLHALVAPLRDDADRMEELVGDGGPDSPHPAHARVVTGDRLVRAKGMRHYHRESCQLVRGKRVRGAKRATHERAGHAPCGMCRP